MRGDGLESLCGGVFELRHGSCGERAQAGFELGPGFFDGIEVGRVGWQVEQGCLASLDPFAYAVDLVRAQVVHNDHVAGTQLRAQYLVEEGQKHVAVGGGLDGHGGQHAGVVHGAEDGEYLSLPAGNPVADALSLPGTPVPSRHLRRDAAFVYVDQAIGRDRADGLEVGVALLEVVSGVALGGVE